MLRWAKKSIESVIGEYNYFGVIIAYMSVLVLGFILTSFTKFHVELILKNNTTLEHLDAKRNKAGIVREYDLGRYNNWVSVFGKRKVFWFLPISTVPMVSDGIIWMKNDREFNAQTFTMESRG